MRQPIVAWVPPQDILVAREARRRALDPKPCLRCGTEFKPACIARWNRAKYCSIQCRLEGMWGKRKGKRYPKECKPHRPDGRSNRSDGYVQVYLGHIDGKPRYELEHRLRAMAVLGRPLKPNETVHHIDMNRANNKNSNLLICDTAYHGWLHSQMALAWIREHILAVDSQPA